VDDAVGGGGAQGWQTFGEAQPGLGLASRWRRRGEGGTDLLVSFLFFWVHGIKSFVVPTKSFAKIGTTKIFCYNKMFSSINQTFGCCSKNFGCRNKKLFVVPNFVAVTKPFFSVCFACSELPYPK